MAAMRLVRCISRPTKILLQHLLQESPNKNPVYRSRLNSNPNPSTTARAFSTGPGSDGRPHWATEYRRVLGIGDAQLTRRRPAAHRRPPKEGEIKINLCTLQSPNIIAVHRSLLGSNPNPKYPHPDQHHAGFPSTTARPFSTGSRSRSDEFDVRTEMRRSLGIGDSEVIYHPPESICLPPKDGFVKIHFGGTFGDDSKTEHIGAAARDSSGKVIGFTAGTIPHTGDELLLWLYALKASANLAEELKRTGVHVGPVVYETSYGLFVCCFTQRREGFLEYIFPTDEALEQVGLLCPVFCGLDMDILRELKPGCFDRVESGVSPTRLKRVALPSKSYIRPHWATEYRRRLGIGDALVIRHPRSDVSPPPKDGEIKINFYVDGTEETAVATNSSGDVLGVTEGSNKHDGAGNELEFQLYALKAAADLAKRLKSTGAHDGPVVYVTSYALLARCFHDLEDEDVLKSQMPRDEDLEEFGRSCRIQCWIERSPCDRPQCEAECRRRLGIGDARVIKQPPIALWQPPKKGEIKITFYADLADDGNKGDVQRDEYHDGGVITALARDSRGVLLGVTTGLQRYKRGDEIGLQLYALKAASNLAGELKRTGRHDGPVVYESASALLVRSLHEDCEDLMSNMPPDQDLEAVGRSCPTHCGGGDGLRVMLPASVASLVDAQEKHNAFSGLT